MERIPRSSIREGMARYNPVWRLARNIGFALPDTAQWDEASEKLSWSRAESSEE